MENVLFRLSSRFYYIALYCLIIGFFSGLLTSCALPRRTSYFRDISRDTSINVQAIAPKDLVIKNYDLLSVNISSLSAIEDAIYNPVISSTSPGDVPGGLLVGSDGYIFIHNIGKVKAAGLTRNQLKSTIESQLKNYLKDPLVTINFLNHHVTVIGEISTPQLMPIHNERLSIIDLVAQAGATLPTAKVDRVLVIRDSADIKSFHHVSLEDHSIFTSPFYYLQPDDVVVLKLDEKAAMQQAKLDRYRQYSSSLFQILSIVLIVYQVFIRR